MSNIFDVCPKYGKALLFAKYGALCQAAYGWYSENESYLCSFAFVKMISLCFNGNYLGPVIPGMQYVLSACYVNFLQYSVLFSRIMYSVEG